MLSAILLWLQSNPPGHDYLGFHAGLLPQLTVICLVPSISLVAISYLRAAIAPWYEDAVDCGMDLAIVGTMAIASIFANDKIHENWGDWVAITGIAVVLLCIDLIGKLAKIPRPFTAL